MPFASCGQMCCTMPQRWNMLWEKEITRQLAMLSNNPCPHSDQLWGIVVTFGVLFSVGPNLYTRFWAKRANCGQKQPANTKSHLGLKWLAIVGLLANLNVIHMGFWAKVKVLKSYSAGESLKSASEAQFKRIRMTCSLVPVSANQLHHENLKTFLILWAAKSEQARLRFSKKEMRENILEK